GRLRLRPRRHSSRLRRHHPDLKGGSIMPSFGSMGLQEPGGSQMGVIQSPSTPAGDTLPYSAGMSPVGTGAGWLMMPDGQGLPIALGTLATGTTNLNCALYNYFSFTCYGGAMTLVFQNMLVGQQIQLLI